MYKKFPKTSILVTAIVLLLVLELFGIISPIKHLFIFITKPVETFVYNVSFNSYSFISNLFHSQRIASENEQLRSELTEMRLNMIELDSLKDENIYLRQELNFIKQSDEKAIVADIIGKPLMQNELLIINKGWADGVEVGLPVIANQGVMAGKIFKVEQNKSYVVLLSNTKSSIAVSVNNNNHTQGVVKGNLGLGLIMDLIPLNEQISAGDLVYTSGLEDKIAGKYLVGEIISILSKDNDLYQKAEIEPLIDYNRLKYLTVVLP